MSEDGSPPLLWLRAASERPVVRLHLEALRRRFVADGWTIHRGPGAPAPPHGILAVADDPWIEPLPRLARALASIPEEVAEADGATAPHWRCPSVFGLDGPQGWRPDAPPYTLAEYERQTLPATPSAALAMTRAETGPWTGLAVAPAATAAELLTAGWPPPPERCRLVPEARLFRYRDPADHERRELDRFVPADARTLVDVGCGAGAFAARHRSPGRLVIGIEPDAELASRAAERIDRVLGTTAEEAFGELEPGVDCFVFADVLEHTTDPAAILEGAARRLSDGGRIIASIPNTAFGPVQRALAGGRWDQTLAGIQARDHLVPMTADSFERLAAGCGLRVLEREGVFPPLSDEQLRWNRQLAALETGAETHLAAGQWVFVLGKRATAVDRDVS